MWRDLLASIFKRDEVSRMSVGCNERLMLDILVLLGLSNGGKTTGEQLPLVNNLGVVLTVFEQPLQTISGNGLVALSYQSVICLIDMGGIAFLL